MTVVSEDDVQALLLRELTDNEQQWFDRLADFAQAQVEAALPGFAIEAGSETAEVLTAAGGELWTPKYPVREVTSLTFGSGVIASSSYLVNELGKIEMGVRTLLNEFEVNLCDGWPSTGVYTVEYDYGFDTEDTDGDGHAEGAPLDVVHVIANVLARAFKISAAGGEGVRQESLGSYSVTYEGTTDVILQVVEQEVRMLRRWKRNRMVSTPLKRAQ